MSISVTKPPKIDPFHYISDVIFEPCYSTCNRSTVQEKQEYRGQYRVQSRECRVVVLSTVQEYSAIPQSSAHALFLCNCLMTKNMVVRSFVTSFLPFCGAYSMQINSRVHVTRMASKAASRRPLHIAATSTTQSRLITGETGNNVTPYIEALVGRGLHLKKNHPLGIIKQKIESYFNSLEGANFHIVDNLDPLVTAQELISLTPLHSNLLPRTHCSGGPRF